MARPRRPPMISSRISRPMSAARRQPDPPSIEKKAARNGRLFTLARLPVQLWTRVTVTVVAEIGPGCRVIRLEALHAVAGGIAADITGLSFIIDGTRSV